MDESIDILDVVLLVNFVLCADEPTNIQLQIADFNDDVDVCDEYLGEPLV